MYTHTLASTHFKNWRGSSPFPLSLTLHSLPPLSPPLFHSPPLNSARGLGERCKLPHRVRVPVQLISSSINDSYRRQLYYCFMDSREKSIYAVRFLIRNDTQFYNMLSETGGYHGQSTDAETSRKLTNNRAKKKRDEQERSNKNCPVICEDSPQCTVYTRSLRQGGKLLMDYCIARVVHLSSTENMEYRAQHSPIKTKVPFTH